MSWEEPHNERPAYRVTNKPSGKFHKDHFENWSERSVLPLGCRKNIGGNSASQSFLTEEVVVGSWNFAWAPNSQKYKDPTPQEGVWFWRTFV
jgi:hypothetical protein